jgi:hypothetical protein
VLHESLQHPNDFYANVHTAGLPGAIRGQLKYRRP